MNERWEYWTGILTADIENPGAEAYLAQHWPNWDAPKYAAQAMIPELNEMGAQGWELVHMEPVANVGRNGDIYFNGEVYTYTNKYFCVFKRPVG